jgi:hypothetical protein
MVPMRCKFVLVALALYDIAVAQLPPAPPVVAQPLPPTPPVVAQATPAPVVGPPVAPPQAAAAAAAAFKTAAAVGCDPLKIANCYVVAEAKINVTVPELSEKVKKDLCLALNDYGKCYEDWLKLEGAGCAGDLKTKWVEYQTQLRTDLNNQKGIDCSSIDFTPETNGASSGNSGFEKSSASSGFDKVSLGLHYWQWLTLILCICTCCAGAIVGFMVFALKGGKKARGRKNAEEEEEDEDDYYDDDGEYDEEDPFYAQPTEASEIPMAMTGNALDTGVLQSNPTASMTLADPTYMQNDGYAP